MTPEYRKQLLRNLLEASPIVVIIGLIFGLVLHSKPSGVDDDQRAVKHFVGSSDLYKACPPGHLVEFQLPSTTLYLDLRWLGSGTIIDLFNAHGAACPTDAVKRVGVDFNGSIPRLLGIDNGLGIFRMSVGGSVASPGRASSPPIGSSLPSQSDRPRVENVTTKPPTIFGLEKGDSGGRIYELHYPATLDRGAQVFMFECVYGGGKPPTRLCHMMVQRNAYAGVYRSYILTQTKLPVPDREAVVSSDSSMEPGALLEFDIRFQDWLLERQRKP